MPKYRVEYVIEGYYDSEWQNNNVYNDGSGDGMILSPSGSFADGDAPFRIPKNAKVTEIALNGCYISLETGSVWRRISRSDGDFIWQRFSSGLWVDREIEDEIEWMRKYRFERLEA